MSGTKGNASVVRATEASGEATPFKKESIVINSTEVQVSSQPVFNFGDHAVRVVVRDGEPWFVASDVCGALDYKNTSKAVGDHLDDDEKMTLTTGYGHSEKGTQIVRTPNESLGVVDSGKRTAGGARLTVIINESGLYALVLRSRKPEARKFAKWVTGEVLPAIRKTGIYVGKPFAVNPGDALTQEEQNTLRLMLKGAADRQPKAKQGALMVKGWSKLKAHFGVSYREIPRSEFTEAVSILARHTAEWEVVDDEPAKDHCCDKEKIAQAFSLASEVASQASRTVFDAVMAGEEFEQHRWMFSLAYDREGNPTRPHAAPLKMGALTLTMKDLAVAVLDHDCFYPSDEELANLAASCNKRLSERITFAAKNRQQKSAAS